MSQTENTPNFDDMSPDEIMAWMESLAKRQGANEGFTTAADVDIPDIDPDTVIIDEPGYVPYEESLRQPKPAAPAAPPPSPMPMFERTPAPPPPSPLPIFSPPPPVMPPPAPMPQASAPEPVDEDILGAAIGDNAMAWLQSLAADQDAGEFSLDLSSLDDELDVIAPAPPPPPVQTTVNPQSWLKSIAQEAESEIPLSISQPPPPPKPRVSALENPTSLLDSFASGAGFLDDAVRAAPELRQQPDMSIEGIERAIQEGRVTVEQMKRYQELQMERASHIPEPEIEEELEEEAEPAELPDWLEELNPESAIEEEQRMKRQTGQLPPLESILSGDLPTVETGALNVPDWLADDDSISETAASIFDDAPAAQVPIEIDATDPWVEALDEEYAHGGMPEEEPEWYLHNISDPARITRVETSGMAAVPPQPEPVREADEMPAVASIQILPVPLAEAALPVETSLRAGERQSVPGWMTSTSTQTMVAVSAPEPLTVEEFSPSTPDWLRSTDEQPATILDWQTAQAPEPAEPVITYVPPSAPPPPVAPPPPAPAASGTLEEARSRYQGGDLDGSLTIYEILVRAGQSLADVAGDLTSIAGSSKNPVAYRVLGDSLMRQGRLQDALNTYRQALNLL
jgi:hypothetical protein